MPENPRIEELRRRVLADPASIAFAALAEEFRRVGALPEAIETCRTGLQRHPAYLSARVTLGRALIETGDYDAAREEFETVLRSAPENLAAIRGLAQINERLGHSTEMDPHLAELMREEAARVAALPPPAPVPPPAPLPEPVFDAVPIEVEPQQEREITLAEPEPAREIAWAREPEPEMVSAAPEPDVENLFAHEPASHVAAATPTQDPTPPVTSDPGSDAEPAFAIDLDSSIELETARAPESVFAIHLEPETQPEPAFQVSFAPEPGPDPQILATLARLEHFLAAIETARHA